MVYFCLHVMGVHELTKKRSTQSIHPEARHLTACCLSWASLLDSPGPTSCLLRPPSPSSYAPHPSPPAAWLHQSAVLSAQTRLIQVPGRAFTSQHCLPDDLFHELQVSLTKSRAKYVTRIEFFLKKHPGLV